jgi:acyl-CoA thioesterase FadM
VVLLTASVLVVTIKDGKPARLPPDIAKLFNPASA